MKTILYIGKYNAIIGGIERYMQKSAELLQRNGFTVHYRYLENGGRDESAFASAFATIKKFSPDDELLQSCDMIIVHNIIDVKYLQYLPAERTFFFAHDHNIYCRRHHYYTFIGRINCHRPYNKFICQLCSLGRNQAPPLKEYRNFPALVLSDFVGENLHKNGFEKVVKLPAFIPPAENPREIMPGGVLRILFLGQLIRGKGADLMLKILAQLDIPFACTIAGEGNDRPMLEKMVKKLNLSDKVNFTGFVSKPETLYRQCDIFCFPIRWQEPFGRVALEAMAHGVPVMAFDLGGVREYLDANCGLPVPEKDFAAAAAALKQLYLHPEKSAQLGDEARKLVKEKFSESAFIEKFTRLCEALK